MLSSLRFLRPTAARLQGQARRGMAGFHPKATAKEIWLGDPATYPIIVIMGFATAMCSTVALRCLFTNPDVRITKKARTQVIRDWS